MEAADTPTRRDALPPDALAALERGVASGDGGGRGARSLGRRLGALTSVLVLGVVAALGFIGGVEVQKRHGTSQVSATGPGGGGAGGGAAARAAATSTSAGAASSAPAGPAGSGPGGAGGRPGGAGQAGGARPGALAAGAATAGQVKLVDGNNIYVTDASGNLVKVVTTASSRFTKTGAGSIQDVRPGDNVVVQGQKGEDGIVTATAVANSGNTSAP